MEMVTETQNLDSRPKKRREIGKILRQGRASFVQIPKKAVGHQLLSVWLAVTKWHLHHHHWEASIILVTAARSSFSHHQCNSGQLTQLAQQTTEQCRRSSLNNFESCNAAQGKKGNNYQMR